MTLRSLALMVVAALVLAVQPLQGQLAPQTVSVTNNTPVTVDGPPDAFEDISFTFGPSSFPAQYNVISDVDMVLTFEKAPDFPEDFPFYNEMSFELFDPSGARSSILIDADSFTIGQPATSFNGTITFNDSEAQPVNANPDQPQAGAFRPITPLAVFNGVYTPGTWTLRIGDNNAGAPLRFSSGTLSITAVPEPGTVTLLATAGLLGGAAAWRRRRARATTTL